MDFKLVGSILMIVGTSIGAGMLALPVATASLGFPTSLILLVVCWFVITISALLLLEVNLWLPQNSHLISMARATIGPLGQIISWLTYLLLLYSLLCAYISGGSQLFDNLLLSGGFKIPMWMSSIAFAVIFGSIVFLGIHSVDYTNRGLMVVKFFSYFLLVFLLFPYISLDKVASGSFRNITSATAITVTITSFGYSPIVPSLRVYFAGDLKKLKTAIFVGSFIPLVCYALWDAVIMGIIPLDGSHGLIGILHSENSTGDLVNILSSTTAKTSITFFAKLFTSICMITSFLGVGLCLTDFLADGLQLERDKHKFIVSCLTFLPPLILVLFFPNIFITALHYAGIYAAILLILLPGWMAWRGRYHKHIAKGFKVPGGKGLLGVIILFALIAIVWGLVGA